MVRGGPFTGRALPSPPGTHPGYGKAGRLGPDPLPHRVQKEYVHADADEQQAAGHLHRFPDAAAEPRADPQPESDRLPVTMPIVTLGYQMAAPASPGVSPTASASSWWPPTT